jgi:NAD+ kinase
MIDTNKGHVVGINGNLLTVEFDSCVTQNEVAYAKIGDLKLKSEVIRVRGNRADLQVFESTAGSGICISTQCGSTGANRALSGAVVDSGLQILQLCEIMPISHHNHSTLRNPYIMRVDRKIDIKITSSNPVYAIYDHLSRELKNITQIHIEASAKKVRFARYRTYSYLTRLRNLY